MEDMVAVYTKPLADAARESARLNKIAASFSAVAALLTAISSLLAESPPA